MWFRVVLGCCLCAFAYQAFASEQYTDEQYAAVRKGMFVGLEFGYLLTHYSGDLDRYASSTGNQSAQGSEFAFRGSLGYNYNKIYGLSIGMMHYQDRADGSSGTFTRQSKLNLTILDAVALFHLKLNDERSWVATPKVGLALERGKLQYTYVDSTGTTPPPWPGSSQNDNTDVKTTIVPTVGIEFAHSMNKHFAMTFGYEYFFGDYAVFGDPYKTPMSSIHYFSVGGIYKF